MPRFLQARVTAVPRPGAVTPAGLPLTFNPEVSAARMVFPSGTDLSSSGQPLPDTASIPPQFALFATGSSIPTKTPDLLFSDPFPADASPNIWTTGDLSHGEFLHQDGATRFEAGRTGVEHLFMRPQTSGDELSIRLDIKHPPSGPSALVADLGFRGRGSGTVTATIVEVQCFQDAAEQTGFGSATPVPGPVTAAANTGQTTRLVVPVVPAKVPGLSGGVGSFDHLRIELRFSFSGPTPAEPPVLYGVRLVP